MATGDVTDFARRIAALLPPWFPDPVESPVTFGLIYGVSTVMAHCYSLLAYMRLQMRLSTSTDIFLDFFAADFFGTGLQRRAGENDNPYRARIAANLFLEKATRNGMVRALTLLTGNAPTIIEPARPQDVFCLGQSGIGAAPLGSYQMNNQAFITVYQSSAVGGALVAGLGSSYAGLGAPYLAMESEDALYGSAQLMDIYATIEATKPLGSTMWTHVTTSN